MLLSLLLTGCAWLTDKELAALRDGDTDGVPAWEDCDDEDPTVDGTQFEDLDGDGLGGAAAPCPGPGVERAGDCDDTDATVLAPTDWYPDADGDGIRSIAPTSACDAPGAGWGPTPDEDCDDADATVGIPTQLYTDADGDGYGDPATGRRRCPGDGITDDDQDCDDTDAHVFPGAPADLCTGADANCDGQLDVDPSFRDFILAGPDDFEATPGLGGALASGEMDGAGAIVAAAAPGAVVLHSLTRGHVQTTAQRFAAITGEGFGTALAVGDAFVDEAGAGDLVVGAGGWADDAGMVAIFDVPPGGGDLRASAARVTWEGAEAGDRVGAALTLVEGTPGDDAPSLDPSFLVVGAPGRGGGVGAAWILALDAAGMTGTHGIDDATFALTAEAGGAGFGLGTATAAYTHPDGGAFVLVTAPGFDGTAGRTDAGAVFLSGYGDADVLGGAVPAWVGSRADEGAGAAVTAGDLTGDGVPELVVAAPEATWELNERAGIVYVLDGAEVAADTGASDRELASALLIVGGDAPDRRLGRSLLVMEATEGAPDGTQYLLMGAQFGACEDFGAVYRWVPVAEGASGRHTAGEAQRRLTGTVGSGLGAALANGGPYGFGDLVWVGTPDESGVNGMTFSSER